MMNLLARSSVRHVLGLLGCTFLLGGMVGMLPAQANLLLNGDAEAGTLAGWTDPLGNGFAVSTSTVASGQYSFTAGPSGPAGSYNHELRQDVSIAGLAGAIDAGEMMSSLRGVGRSNAAGGYVDAGYVQLEFLDSNCSALSTYGTGTFAPHNAWQSFADRRVVPVGTRTLRLRLRGSRPIGGSTDCFFDDLQLGVYQWRAMGAGCAGANGTPDLQLVEPPWIGSTYELLATNLTGGFGLMVVGFTGVSLPLQPFGLGFGSGCILQASPELLQPLPQVGGQGTWSLAVPANPALAGFEVWNQVAELAPVSAVSTASRAVLR